VKKLVPPVLERVEMLHHEGEVGGFGLFGAGAAVLVEPPLVASADEFLEFGGGDEEVAVGLGPSLAEPHKDVDLVGAIEGLEPDRLPPVAIEDVEEGVEAHLPAGEAVVAADDGGGAEARGAGWAGEGDPGGVAAVGAGAGRDAAGAEFGGEGVHRAGAGVGFGGRGHRRSVPRVVGCGHGNHGGSTRSRGLGQAGVAPRAVRSGVPAGAHAADLRGHVRLRRGQRGREDRGGDLDEQLPDGEREARRREVHEDPVGHVLSSAAGPAARAAAGRAHGPEHVRPVHEGAGCGPGAAVD